MKKFIIALIVTLAFAASSFATSSDDIYVRKDVFEVHMLNINSNLEKILSELQSQRNDINELAKVTAVLSTRIDGVNTRIDDLRNGLYLWLVVIGTFIAWPKAKNFIQSIHYKHDAQNNSFTLEDIEKLIDSKLNAKSKS